MSTDERMLRLQMVNDQLKRASNRLGDSDDPFVMHEALRMSMLAQQDLVGWALSLERDNLRRRAVDHN